MKECVKKGILPIAALGMILIITNEIYMVEGKVDFIRLWMCVGIPFGLVKGRTLWVPASFDLAGVLGALLMFFVICGFFGGFLAIIAEIEAVLVLVNCIIQRITCSNAVY